MPNLNLSPLSLSLAISVSYESQTGWAGDMITDVNFNSSRNSTRSINQLANFDVNIRASRTTGMAPMGVALEGLTQSLFYGVSDPAKELHFYWRKDRDGEVYKNIPPSSKYGNSANKAIGVATVDVLPEAKPYNISLLVIDPLTGRVGMDTITITPYADATVTWDKTIFISPTSDFTYAPVGSLTFSTWDAACTEQNQPDGKGSVGNVRVLFNRGETINVGDLRFQTRRSGIKQFTSHGDSNATEAVIHVEGVTDINCLTPLFYVWDTSAAKEFYANNFSVTGDYDSVTGEGDGWRQRVIGGDHDNLTVYQVDMDGLEQLVDFGTSTTGGNVLVDCKATNWYNFVMFGDIKFGGIHACDFRQKTGVKGGLNGKLVNATDTYYTYFEGDDVTVVVPYTTPVVRGAEYVPADQHFVGYRSVGSDSLANLTVLTSGVDYTIDDNNITLTAPLSSAFELVSYPRHFPIHGPIRTSWVDICCYTLNLLTSSNGWSAGGTGVTYGSHQPTIRNNSSGKAGTVCCTNTNVCEGGAVVIHTGPANDGLDVNQENEAHNVVIEQNTLTGGEFTHAMIGLETANSIARNNVCHMPDITGANEYKYLNHIVEVATWPQSSTDVQNLPYMVYNNTLINLKETQLPIETVISAVGISPTAGAILPTNLSEGNNLIYYPHDPVTTWPDYTPINLTTGQIQVGSAAVDTGVVTAYVFDDVDGLERNANNSIGAFNLPEVASQTLTLDGIDSTVETNPANQFNLDAGDFFYFEAATSGVPSAMEYMLSANAGVTPNVRITTFNRLYFDSSNYDFYFDDVLVTYAESTTVSNAFTWNDGNIHSYKLVAKNSLIGLTMLLGCNGNNGGPRSGFANMIVKNPSVNIGGLTSSWALSSGNTATETPALDENSIGDMILTGINSTNYE